MTALPKETLLAIISDLARDRSVVDVAARHHVAADVVAKVRNDFGPNLGRLAKSAEDLRKAPLIPDGPPEPVDTSETILERAEKVPALAVKAARVRALMIELVNGLDAAEKRAAAERLVAQRRAELAKAEALLAEAKGKKKAPAHDNNATIRTWAKAQGLTVAATGRVPQAIRDQYEAAQA